jgi:uncharacterized membrane protein
MDDPRKLNKLPVIGIALILLIWLLSLPAQNLFEVSQETYNDIGSWLGYKKLLNICWSLLLLVVTLTILYFSKHVSKKDSLVEAIIKPEIKPAEQKPIVFPKKEPANPIDYEKFHTFNGLTYKYDSRDGTLYHGIYCPDDKVVMQSRYIFNGNYLWECPICKKNHKLSDEESKLAHVNFSNILIAFTKGHLKKLPAESKKVSS